MMQVEINQWRATIGCFRVSIQISSPLSKSVRPFCVLVHILKLYWICCCFIAVSIIVLPLALMIHFLAVHSVATQRRLMSLFARMHRLAKIVIYTTVEPLLLVLLAASAYLSNNIFFCMRIFYIGSINCYTFHTQWLVFRTLLLSGDVETNPGPETLDFCAWNLNCISAHDFLRVSLIEAYNSVYNYDLIGIVETHFDSTTENDRLALDGYSFIKSNHPQNVNRGGVGLYVKDSLATKNRSD